MNPEGQGLIISNGAGQLLGLVPITVLEPGDEVYMDEFTLPVLLIPYETWVVKH